MNTKDSAVLANRKAAMAVRRERRTASDGAPVLGRAVTRFEVSDRVRGVHCGGLAAIEAMVRSIGLRETIDDRVRLFKRHKPYFESDHVLNMAYCLLAGGRCIEDLEALRNDPEYLDMLGAAQVSDPTTMGDFCRRFDRPAIDALQDAVNEVRTRVWRRQRKISKALATIDVDGTMALTHGECKQGADFNYKKEYGYGPLVVTLAQTQDVLFVANRSGNRPSHEGCVPYVDRAIDLARDSGFRCVRVRGDTDFSLTANFDRWTDAGVEFVFGMDANPAFVTYASSLPESTWKPFRRQGKRRPKTARRARPRKYRDDAVRARGYRRLRLEHEHIVEVEHTPTKAKRPYRLVVVRKNISVEAGEDRLFDEIRYFFYITNIPASTLTMRNVVRESNARCTQENLIEQLKNGVGAMRMPTKTLESNWAYMAIACLAWNLKAWSGLLHPDTKIGRAILRMEFPRFVRSIVHVLCQVVRQARRTVLRVINISRWVRAVVDLHDHLRGPPPRARALTSG